MPPTQCLCKTTYYIQANPQGTDCCLHA